MKERRGFALLSCLLVASVGITALGAVGLAVSVFYFVRVVGMAGASDPFLWRYFLRVLGSVIVCSFGCLTAVWSIYKLPSRVAQG